MDFTVEIGEPGLMTEPAPSVSALSTPELSAARAEYEKVMSDPTHKHYEGFRRGSKEADNYVNELYRKALAHPAAPPPSVPVIIEEQQGLSVRTGGPDDPEPALSPEDAQAVEDLKHPSEWGADFETHLSDARFGSSRLTQTLGASVDDLTAAVLDAGGDLKFILKIASHFEKRMRAHEQGPH